jgi:hypothetical protein
MKYNKSSTNPLDHASNIKRMLSEVIEHARSDIEKVNEPKFQVLLETTAEVLIGLRTAYEHYETKQEPAMA